MADATDGVQIPGWLWKVVLGVAQAIMMTALTATIAWAWNTESRVALLEHEKAVLMSRVSSAETQLETVSKNHLEIEILKTELGYIKSGISDIKDLLTDRR